MSSSEEIIRAFGSRFGLDLELDENSACNFEVDDVFVTIVAMDEIEQIVLMGDIGAPPEFEHEKLFRLMLEANYLYGSTRGSTIALNESNDHVVLTKYLPLKLQSEDSLYSEVETLISVCEIWRQIMKDVSLSPAPADGEEKTRASEVLGNFMSV
ncbi:MAG: type III secretion system chaperone [Succinivibrionaceae bacterium]|nr:type III secretion system chaperone [Succinivibrionaceae bacterium]